MKGLGLLLALAAVARLPRLTQAGSAGQALLWMASELSVCALLYAMMERLSRTQVQAAPAGALNLRRPFWTGLSYAVNPLALFIGPSGHLVGAAAALVLAAAWFMDFSEHPASDLLSALCLSAAGCFHPWALLALPAFLKNLEGSGERLSYFWAWMLPLGLSLGARAYAGLWKPWLPELSGGLFGISAALSSAFYGSLAPQESAQAAGLMLGQVLAWLLVLGWAVLVLGPWRFPLLPGAALAALSWCAASGGLDSAGLLAPLALGLLIPGGMALRLTAVAGLAFLAWAGLFAPWELQAPALWKAPGLPRAFHLAWAAFQLGLWFFFVVEWASMLALCRHPKGRLEYR